MITLQLSPGDIEKVRFAYSPLIEVVSSFKLLQTPERPCQAIKHGSTRHSASLTGSNFRS